MTDKLIEIKITKATMFVYERELMKHLPPELIMEGLKRGKGILRQRQQKSRETELFQPVSLD